MKLDNAATLATAQRVAGIFVDRMNGIGLSGYRREIAANEFFAGAATAAEAAGNTVLGQHLLAVSTWSEAVRLAGRAA